MYVQPEVRKIPVARLVSVLERELKAAPKDADLHIRLARLYGMAYAVNADEIDVAVRRDGAEEVWFGHEPPLIPHRIEPGGDGTRGGASRVYLQKATAHYRAALDLNPESLLARLGYGWALEQAGDTAGAIAEYRQVVERAWRKEASSRAAQLGQRFYTPEAAGYLVRLLDPVKNAAEIAELRARMDHFTRIPRPITPIAIPLSDRASVNRIVDADARVPFDADGSGLARSWTWITADAGWLVYDPEHTGRITSALQWFGNVTFWLFWNHGYEPLAALDDDGDGELRGAELRHLAIWHDANGDGVSDPGEVRPLADHRIVALSCRSTAADGLLVAAKSDAGVRFSDGRVRPTYDVILRPAVAMTAPGP